MADFLGLCEKANLATDTSVGPWNDSLVLAKGGSAARPKAFAFSQGPCVSVLIHSFSDQWESLLTEPLKGII